MAAPGVKRSNDLWGVAEGRMRGIRVVLLTLSVCVIIYFALISEVYPGNFIFSWTNSNIEIYTNNPGNLQNVYGNDIGTEIIINSTCLAGVVIAQNKGGRLANRLMEYASIWSLAMLYNLTPVVVDETYSRITPLLSNLSVSPASIFIEKLRKKNSDCAELAVDLLLKGKIAPVNSDKLAVFEREILEKKLRQPVVLKPFIVLVEPIARSQAILREEFRYRQKYNLYAQQTLRRAAAGLENTTFEEQVAYVGVHARRTDYPRYLSKKFGLKRKIYANEDYYVRAMEYMLLRLRKNGILKVVFAVASDDKEWTKKNLIPKLEKNLESRRLLGTNATVSWCGSENPMNDLVLLSACNHSIISYGTYGCWSALMAGGWTVVYDIDPKRKIKRMSSAMIFAKSLSNWTAIH